MARLRHDTGLCYLYEWIPFEVNERHIAAVKNVVIVLFQRRPFGSEGIRRIRGSQAFVQRCVLDS